MDPGLISAYASAIASAGLAIASLLRAGSSAARWSFAAGMAIFAAESVLLSLSLSATTPDRATLWLGWRLVVGSALPGTWLLFAGSYARGDSTPSFAGNRVLLAGAFLVPLALAVAFRPTLIQVVEGGWGIYRIARFSGVGLALTGILLVASIAILRDLERTFRGSVGTMRWRIKFMLLGVGLLFVVRVYTTSQALLYRGYELPQETVQSVTLIIACLLMVRSFFRSGHFDIKVYPSQAALQSSLTILIAGAYLLIVGVLAKIVSYYGGDSAFALKAFVILTSLVLLAIVLQSDRARLRLRQFISRHFHRSPYDYRAVWKTFTDGTASRVEQGDLARVLAKLVADTFQALSVTIWAANDTRDGFVLAASTASAAARERIPEISGGIAESLKTHFAASPEPTDIDSSKSDWAGVLKDLNPVQFAHGGNRVCVPLIGRGELQGFIVVGDRVGGLNFTVEDFDMLKCVGDHAAASLLNVQLSSRVAQSKQLEAFQSMAAFFVHDLKNAASTLNLMLQNLPVHFDDPEFRQDALRGIGKTVNHINGLIGKLGVLRHELKIQRGDADLNDLVAQVLGGIEQGARCVIKKDIRPLPNVPIDRDQMIKVVTNLLLNAAEAVPANGEIQVGTSQENGWAVLTVADNGCGMSPEFLSGSLFRPFQTTKKNGLGIGMFQSKMIVEAHGGKISVTSEPGKGTTFRVFLRTSAPASRAGL